MCNKSLEDKHKGVGCEGREPQSWRKSANTHVLFSTELIGKIKDRVKAEEASMMLNHLRKGPETVWERYEALPLSFAPYLLQNEKP